MKVIFLDVDGVLNSHQSATFWHSKRDQETWETSMYKEWEGTIKEYIAREFCPIALSNTEELVRQVPGVKIVVSSTWRLGETVETLKKILYPAKLVADAIIDVTPSFHRRNDAGEQMTRGHEIQDWLNRHPEVDKYVIIDDDSDMLDSQKENFVKTSGFHGFQHLDMLWALRILGEKYR